MASHEDNTFHAPHQPQSSEVPQEHIDVQSRGRDQLVAPPSRPGSDPFVEASRDDAVSGNQPPSVPRFFGTERDAPHPQRSLHGSNTSMEVYSEKHVDEDNPRDAGHNSNNNDHHAQTRTRDGTDNGKRENIHLRLSIPPQPPQSTRGDVSRVQSQRQPRNIEAGQSVRPSFIQRQSELDWIVPSTEAKASNLAQRLQPTLDVAAAEKDKYALKAKWTGWTLNAAIGVQVLLGSLTTGLSAVATSGHKSTAVSTTILGALATLVASYLARARGSNEPELSIARVKDLEQFIRECEAFKMDHGHITGHELDHELESKRRKFEELLGNANGERRLAPPV